MLSGGQAGRCERGVRAHQAGEEARNAPAVAGMNRMPAPMPTSTPWVTMRAGIVRQKPAATRELTKRTLPPRTTLRKPKSSTALPAKMPVPSVRAVQVAPIRETRWANAGCQRAWRVGRRSTSADTPSNSWSK